MKTNDKIIIGIFAVMIATLLAVRAADAFPFGMGMGGNMHGMNFNFPLNNSGEFNITQMKEFHASLQNTIESKDFNAWKSLMISQLTQEHFNHLVAMHEQRNETFYAMNEMHEKMEEFHEQMIEARKSGNVTEFMALKQEFHEDFPGMMGKMHGNMHQRMHGFGFRKFDKESSQ